MSRTSLSTLLALFSVAVAVFVAGLHNEAAATNATAEAVPKPVEPSMHEFMEYVFQPTYRRLKASMAKADKSKANWKAVKSDALILAEGGNLLLVREVKKTRQLWEKYSVDVRTLGGNLYQAARKRDEKTAQSQYRKMLNACNQCHQKYAGGKYQLKP